MAYDGTLKFDTKVDTSGFSSGISKIAGIAKTGLGAAVTAIGAVSTALSTAGGFAVKTGMDFEAQMSRVKAISGATGSEFESLKQQAIDLGAATSFSATESAQAMENLASAGFSVSEIMDAMPGMLDQMCIRDRAYPRSKLREYEEKTVTYNGKTLSYYDATQQQRYIERQIRRWKREYLMRCV